MLSSPPFAFALETSSVAAALGDDAAVNTWVKLCVAHHLRQPVAAQKIEIAGRGPNQKDVELWARLGSECAAQVLSTASRDPQLSHRVIRRELLETSVTEAIHAAVTDVCNEERSLLETESCRHAGRAHVRDVHVRGRLSPDRVVGGEEGGGELGRSDGKMRKKPHARLRSEERGDRFDCGLRSLQPPPANPPIPSATTNRPFSRSTRVTILVRRFYQPNVCRRVCEENQWHVVDATRRLGIDAEHVRGAVASARKPWRHRPGTD